MRYASSFRLLSQLVWTHAGIQANELDVTSGLLFFAPPEFSMKKGEAGNSGRTPKSVVRLAISAPDSRGIPYLRSRTPATYTSADDSSASCVWLATGTCAIAQVSPRGGAHVRLRDPLESL